MMGTISSVHTRRVASGFYQAGGMGFGAVATWQLIRLSSRIELGTEFRVYTYGRIRYVPDILSLSGLVPY